MNKLIHRPPASQPSKGKLLFIHGVCHGAWCWDEQWLPYFAEQGYDSYALTLRMHEEPGRTPGIHRLRLRDYVRDVEEAVAHIGEPPVLIGHSMGGLIVQKYLSQHPARAAVLLAAVPPEGILRTSLRYISRHPGDLRFFIRGDFYGFIYHRGRDLVLGENFSEERAEIIREKLCDESFRVFLEMHAPRVRLRNPKVPMLVLGAENDVLVTPVQVQKTARRYGTEALIFPDMAHEMMLDRGQEEVRETIREWMEGCVLSM